MHAWSLIEDLHGGLVLVVLYNSLRVETKGLPNLADKLWWIIIIIHRSDLSTYLEIYSVHACVCMGPFTILGTQIILAIYHEQVAMNMITLNFRSIHTI